MKEVKIIMANGAMGASNNDSSIDMVMRAIALHASSDPKGEWAEKYGTRFENNVFMMHPYCWCEQEECEWCDGTKPNFLYKPMGIKISWYKYIGRGMEMGGPKITTQILFDIAQHCLKSLEPTQ